MKSIYNFVGCALNLVERGLMLLAVLAIMLTSVLVLTEIAAREFLPFHVPDGVTIVAALMVISISFALAHAMSENAHIAVDLFYQHFPAGLQKLCDLVGLLIGFTFSSALVYWSWIDVAKLFRRGSYYYGELQIPEWPVNAALLLGFLVLSIRIMHLFTGRLFGLTTLGTREDEAL